MWPVTMFQDLGYILYQGWLHFEVLSLHPFISTRFSFFLFFEMIQWMQLDELINFLHFNLFLL